MFKKNKALCCFNCHVLLIFTKITDLKKGNIYLIYICITVFKKGSKTIPAYPFPLLISNPKHCLTHWQHPASTSISFIYFTVTAISGPFSYIFKVVNLNSILLLPGATPLIVIASFNSPPGSKT